MLFSFTSNNPKIIKLQGPISQQIITTNLIINQYIPFNPKYGQIIQF